MYRKEVRRAVCASADKVWGCGLLVLLTWYSISNFTCGLTVMSRAIILGLLNPAKTIMLLAELQVCQSQRGTTRQRRGLR